MRMFTVPNGSDTYRMTLLEMVALVRYLIAKKREGEFNVFCDDIWLQNHGGRVLEGVRSKGCARGQTPESLVWSVNMHGIGDFHLPLPAIRYIEIYSPGTGTQRYWSDANKNVVGLPNGAHTKLPPAIAAYELEESSESVIKS